MLLSGASEMRRESPKQYTEMLSVRADPHSAVVEQINTDLHRTFPNNIYFAKANDPRGLQQPLFNVLLAFAHANPDVGYCQGMNYIAGLLLIVTRDEEETFFLLRALAEKILPEYYGPNIPGLITDVRVFAEILKCGFFFPHHHTFIMFFLHTKGRKYPKLQAEYVFFFLLKVQMLSCSPPR